MQPSRFIFAGITWYGVLVVAGMAAAALLAVREEKRLGLPRDTFIDLALLLIPCGILGARLYYVLFTWREYASDPLSILYIWNGGLAVYGGIIAGLLVVLLFARRRKLPAPTLLDCIAPGLALAQGIGRWGNFFNGEAYGLPITDPRFRFFPVGVPIGGEWHLAAFFYESAADILIFLWLWLRRKKRTRAGDTLLGYLLLYGAVRAVIEGLRTDSLQGFIAGLRVSQVLSILLAAGACAVWAARSPARARLWLILPLAALVLAVVLGASGASAADRTASLILYGVSAIACTAILQQNGGNPCPAEPSGT